MIVAGFVLTGIGLWQFMPQSFSSETQNGVFMSIAAKRVVFPILGPTLSIIGYTFFKLIREAEEELILLRNEIRALSQNVEK
jgi:hypothetical protein